MPFYKQRVKLAWLNIFPAWIEIVQRRPREYCSAACKDAKERKYLLGSGGHGKWCATCLLGPARASCNICAAKYFASKYLARRQTKGATDTKSKLPISDPSSIFLRLRPSVRLSASCIRENVWHRRLSTYAADSISRNHAIPLISSAN